MSLICELNSIIVYRLQILLAPQSPTMKKLLKNWARMTKIVSEEAPVSVIATLAISVNASERIENQGLMAG
jgi:hypothetical protein